MEANDSCVRPQRGQGRQRREHLSSNFSPQSNGKGIGQIMCNSFSDTSGKQRNI